MPGRYCWSCERRHPNERFSRRSGLRGVCRDCYRAGPAELAFQQAVRNIDRALHYRELIPRRRRKMIEGFLTHTDERTRAYAARVIARDAEARRDSARLRGDDELAFEAMVALDEGEVLSAPEMDLSDEDIPF